MVAAVRMSTMGLARTPLLAGVPQERLDDLVQRCTWRKFAPGQLIMSRHAPAGEVHLIVEGRVRIHVYGAEGREVLFTHLQEGGIVGDFAAVDGGLRTTDAHASTAVLSASLSATDFKQLLRQEPQVEERYVRYLVGLVRSLTDRVIELSTLGVQNRIRTEVLRLARANGHADVATIEPAPRHADLAAQVGTTREQVTRELSSLTRQGLLRKKGAALEIPQLHRLEEMVRDAGADYPASPLASRASVRGSGAAP